MNGRRAKSIRKYVDKTFPWLSATVIYEPDAHGQCVLNQHCKRHMYQSIKRSWKKAKAYNTTFRRTK